MGLHGSDRGGGARGGSNWAQPIWCSTRSWVAPVIGIFDEADVKSELSQNLGVDEMIGCLLIDLGIRITHQMFDRL